MVPPKRAKILIQKVETFVWWRTSSYPSPYKRLYNSATLESSIFVRFQQIAFQIWQLYFPAVLTVFFFSLTVPCKKLKNRGRIYLKEVTYINCTFLRNFFQINTVSVQLLTYINRVCEVYHYISHLVLLKCKAFSTHYISILSFFKELHSGKKVVVTLAKTALLSTNSFIYYSILFKRRNTPPPPPPPPESMLFVVNS